MLLRVENLVKYFGELRAVDGVNFHINKGEIVGLIGPNGAGKTTVIRLIMGILRPSSGRVIFKGENIAGQETCRIVNKGLAITFQVTKPFRNLPVLDNVMVSALSPKLRHRGKLVKTPEARAQDALEFCGIGGLAYESASILSSGDLKRLELARAIATEPELLILDEPFGGLNSTETDLIIKSLTRLHAGDPSDRLNSVPTTMLIIEHKLSDLLRLVERVIVLELGHVIADGIPSEVVRNKAVIEAYLGKEVI